MRMAGQKKCWPGYTAMGKKKKALLRYKRLGIISKKLEKKFANFLRANVDKINTKVEEALKTEDLPY